MRAVIVERQGAWQVRVVAGDKLPTKFSETELELITHNEESAVKHCFDLDDTNTATYVYFDLEVK